MSASSAGESIVQMPRLKVGSPSGHVQESTREYLIKWNKSMFLCPSLSLPLSLKQHTTADSWPSTSRNPLLWIENTNFDPEVVESYLKPLARKADYIFFWGKLYKWTHTVQTHV